MRGKWSAALRTHPTRSASGSPTSWSTPRPRPPPGRAGGAGPAGAGARRGLGRRLQSVVERDDARAAGAPLERPFRLAADLAAQALGGLIADHEQPAHVGARAG